jgi:ABC-2 type transport system ATP-binding protein
VDSPAIRTEGLSKRYGHTIALADLDLEIARGEVVGYLGPNGAGKTTTIRLLLGLARPTAGRAEIFGLDTQRRRTGTWRMCLAKPTFGRPSPALRH